MTSTNLIVSHLQEQHTRIHKMLSPGLQRQPEDSPHTPLSPVAPDFAGRKFQLAAKKMRVLEPRRLGQFQPGLVTPLNTEIQNKFREPQKLIHIQPRQSRDTSIWSNVDTPLPSTQATRQEGPAEPGVLRQGSIIQRMSTTPKPGQSLDSFKQQIQSQSQRSQPKAAAKRPVLDANARRFSRIQEISSEQKTKAPEEAEAPAAPEVPKPPSEQAAIEPEIPASQPESTPEEGAPSPEKPEATQKPKTETPKVTPSVQREVDQVLEELPLTYPEIEPPVSKPSEKPAEKVVSREKQEEPPASKTEDTVTSQISSETPEVQQIAPETAEQPPAESRTETPVESQSPVEEVRHPKAAIPVKKEPSAKKTELPLKKALPPKKEEPATTRPTAQTPGKKASISTPSVQRQPDEIAPSAQVPSAREESATFDEAGSTPTEEIETGRQDQPEDESQSPSESPEMPLQHQITYRQKAPKAVRTIEPEQLKPNVAPMLIHRIDEPLFMPVKRRSDATIDQRTETPSLSQILSQPRTERSASAFREPQALPMDLSHEMASQTSSVESSVSRLPMPVALTPPESEAVQTIRQQKQPISPLSPRMTQQQATITSPSKASNVVQRLWEEHRELHGQEVGSSSSSQKSDRSSEGGQGAFDLEALAEDVFPYVKRFLEIEANRSSSDKF